MYAYELDIAKRITKQIQGLCQEETISQIQDVLRQVLDASHLLDEDKQDSEVNEDSYISRDKSFEDNDEEEKINLGQLDSLQHLIKELGGDREERKSDNPSVGENQELRLR